MKLMISFRVSAIVSSHNFLTFITLTLLGILSLSLPKVVYSQPEAQAKYRVSLPSRSLIPDEGIQPIFRDSLRIQLDREEKRHVYLQLKEYPTKDERAALEERGVLMLSYIGSYTWHAALTDSGVLEFTSTDAVRRMPILGTIRWIGEIQPSDRLTPEILEERMIRWIRTEDGRERYAVYFFKDISMEIGRRIIQRLGGEIAGEESLTRGFLVTVPAGARDSLISLDEVKLIDLYPPPPADFNDGSRAWCGTNPVHNAGLTGTGVVLGLFEAGGLPENQHVDLTAGRCHHEEVANISWHATHVCGTMIATGAGLAARMGHAPGVGDIHCYTTQPVAPGKMTTALQDHDIVACNNSWGLRTGWAVIGWVPDPATGNLIAQWQFEPPLSANPQTHFGDYRWSCPAFDELVRDSLLVIVFAAGNDRSDPPPANVTAAQPGDWDQVANAGSWDGFHTIPLYGTAKNIITVGAINDGTNLMADFSSWGPTDDGRIKPDIVAPGVDIMSCDDTDTDNDGTFDHYIGSSGTSMAAPAVTGITALLIQCYREEYLGVPASELGPIPSTIKALLCQSAQDMGDAGPDYRFGYGGVRADAARQLILDNQFREGVILAAGDQDYYNFNVTAGDPEIRVTLAWDDFPAGAANPDPTIINDLDLVIQDPAGNYYTPWHLHVTAHDQAVNPATRNSHAVASTNLISEADRDRWNNVEQVLIDPALVGGPLPGGTWRIIVEAHALPEPPQRYSIAANYQFEGEVDIVQVLDRSGSMGGYASGSSADTKIQVLRDAADQFIQIMLPNIGNRLGMVQFNQDLVPFDPTHDTDLSPLTSTRAALLRGTAIPSIVHGGWTSIGDGLDEALDQLTPPPDAEHDQVILLVTDGMENTDKWIADVQQDLIDNHIAVYPLGLGYSHGINEEKLTDLAAATGGSYRITSDNLIFRKFFIEILAGAVDWSVITDPIGELAGNDTVMVPVTITSDQHGATFTTYWEGIDDAIALELVTPSGTVITSEDADSRIRFGDHPRYLFYQLDFPLSGSAAGEWAGRWNMRILATDRIGAGQKVRYSASAFSEGGVQLSVALDRFKYLTGDKVLMKAELASNGKPVLGATIDVYGNVPIVGSGNILHDGKVSLGDLKKIQVMHGDSISLIDRKLQILSERAGRDVLARGTAGLTLYDDGRHNDGKADDGIYANTLAENAIPGSYTFRCAASNIPSGIAGTTTREFTTSFYTGVNIDPHYSSVNVKLVKMTDDGSRYGVKVVPLDRFGNYLGPGYRAAVRISSPGSERSVELADNIDGTYTKEIFISKEELDAGVNLEIYIDGKLFTAAGPPPRFHKYFVSIHSGVAIPTGDLADDFDPGFNVIVDAGYRLSPLFSLGFYAGFNDFRSKTAGIDDNYWINISLNARYHQSIGGALSAYTGLGPGYYIPETGDGAFGANAGLGLDYSVSSHITLEIGADYHTVFDEDVDFAHAHAGVIFTF